jgi:hypothetical protein
LVCASILLKREPDTNVKFSILTQYVFEKEGRTRDEFYEIGCQALIRSVHL